MTAVSEDRPQISVVIRTKNEEEHLPVLLEAIGRQTLPAAEVVVVDSGSVDATVTIAREFGATLVHIDPDEFTFGRAINRGCAVAHHDILVFASAHVSPLDEQWLEKLTAPLLSDPEVVLSYGRQEGDERSHYSEFEIMRRWFPPRSDANQQHPFCNNANCAIRRDAWETAHYDESLTGLEDLKWARDALDLGHRLSYVADAAVLHVHEEEFHTTVNRYRREAIAYQLIFEAERLSAGEAIVLFGMNVVRDYLAAFRRGVFQSNLLAIPRFRLAQFWGAFLGFRSRRVMRSKLKRRFYYPRGFDGLSGGRYDGT